MDSRIPSRCARQCRGRPIWSIAATRGSGFKPDECNTGVTHNIHPAIDGEREYANQTRSNTSLVIAPDQVTPASPLTEAKTVTGGSFHSDGHILALVLKSTAASSYFVAVAPVIFKVYSAVPLGSASRNCALCDSPGSRVSDGIDPWLVASNVLSAPT
jgi:LssY-like putative type I secretion system component LssY